MSGMQSKKKHIYRPQRIGGDVIAVHALRDLGIMREIKHSDNPSTLALFRFTSHYGILISLHAELRLILVVGHNMEMANKGRTLKKAAAS